MNHPRAQTRARFARTVVNQVLAELLRAELLDVGREVTDEAIDHVARILRRRFPTAALVIAREVIAEALGELHQAPPATRRPAPSKPQPPPTRPVEVVDQAPETALHVQCACPQCRARQSKTR